MCRYYHTLGIEVVAEGIETQQQQNLLLDIGCDYGQGFFLAKPMSEREFEKTYLENIPDQTGNG